MSEAISTAMPSDGGAHRDGFVGLDAIARLRPEAREAVASVTQRQSRKAGDWILHAGDTGNAVYFIEAGEVAVLQPAVDGEPEKIIATLSAGEVLGEITVLDGKPRTMSARAATDVTLSELQPDKLLERPDGAQMLGDLKGALGLTVVRRMRTLNTQHVDSLRRELESARAQRQFGHFFVFVMTILCTALIVTNVIAQGVMDIDVHSGAFVFGYSVMLGVPSFLVLWLMKLRLADLGIAWTGLRRSLIEGAGISVVVTVLLLAGAYFAAANGYALNPTPFNPIGTVFYFIHSFLQELIGRGVIQSSLQKFLGGSGFLAVFLGATMFGTVHIHLGLTAVLLTFAASVFFGLIYLRHQNLAGVTLIHFVGGAVAFLTGLI